MSSEHVSSLFSDILVENHMVHIERKITCKKKLEIEKIFCPPEALH